MKCVIPSQNVKIIARGIHSLAKIGDEMFIEPTENELIFRTVNAAQSAFVEFKMTKAFFSSYLFNDDDIESSCKITMRSCISVFKSGHYQMDKQIESCELRVRPEGTVVIFLIKYGNSSVKKHSLPIIESEKLEATVPDGSVNVLKVTSKFLVSLVKNFRQSEDEITLKVDMDKIFIKNHIELKKDYHFLRTELSFHPTDFEEYSIQNPTAITFCFKELRAVLAFVELSHLSVQFLFDSPGQPLVINISNNPVYELIFVISTLNTAPNNTRVNNTTIRRRNVEEQDPFQYGSESENLNLPSTSASRKRPVDSNRPISKKRKTDVTRSLNLNSQNIPDTLLAPEVTITSGSSTKKVDKSKKNKRTSLDEMSAEFNFSFGAENLEIRKNVIPESTIGSEINNSMLNKESCGIVSEYDKLTSGAFKTCSYNENTKTFLRHIFARCYGGKHILETLEAHKNVLVDESEEEF